MAETQTAKKAASSSQSSKAASGQVVKYIGTADVREIDAAAWKQVDVEDQKLVRWHKGNNFTVSVEELSDGAVQYLDEVDDGFVLTNADA